MIADASTYWRAQLAAGPPGLALWAPSACSSASPGFAALALPAALLARLGTLCRQREAPLEAGLLAGFAALLQRHSEQRDLVIGLGGAALLPLRVRVRPEHSLVDLLAETGRVLAEARAHGDPPAHPLQVGLALVDAPSRDALPPALELGLTLWPDGEGLAGELGCGFGSERAQQLGRHLLALLAAAVEAPTLRLANLELLAGDERRTVLEWGSGARLPHPPEHLHALFEAQVERSPEAPALVTREGTLSYRQLEARANRLAHRLGQLGVRGQLVGVFLPRREELLVALLAVLKAGAGYVPLDPGYPPERLAHMLGHSEVPAVVTRSGLLERLPPTAAAPLLLDREEISALPPSRPPPCGSPAEPAYVLYTSGSTGVPKGVAIAHQSAAALLRWAAGIFGAEELAGVLAATSICFDLSVFELFLPLSVGGAVILADDALALAELPAAERVTLINTVPSAIAELVRLGAVPPSVRTVCLAGEPLAPELARAIYRHSSAARVLNLYGPSEDTTYSTWWEVPRGAERVLIGAPIAGTRARVLDAQLQLVPPGVAGELYLGGAGLARGYHRDPERTAERFVPDPFGAGERLYRTGDRVRWEQPGQLAFLGRIDHQIKLRGFRIELGEIEAALRAQPSVAEAVVAVREVAGDKRLVAYVVPEGPAPSWSELRAALGQRLPDFMLPWTMVSLDALPLTPNGKVDRKALPEPAPDRSAPYVAPRTPLEHELCRIFGEVLGLERVGVEDDFFELGGHSLLATQALARMRQSLQQPLPPPALFQAPTVAALARLVGDAGPPPMTRVARGEALPTSFAQQRLWFLHQLSPDSAAYHVPLTLRFRPPLEVAALERALQGLALRHEALRTRFVAIDGVPHQHIAERPELRLEQHAADSFEQARLEMLAAVRERFDLAAGAPVRAHLWHIRDAEQLLLVVMHHIATDGWSMGVVQRDLAELYAVEIDARPPRLEPLPLQYADYAAWHRTWLASGVLDAQLAYWKEQLADAPAALELPTDRPRPAVRSERGDVVPVAIGAELNAALGALGREHGATSFMTVLAALAVLLARYAGQPEVVVGAPAAGRSLAETEPMVGFFVNTLALRVRPDPRQSFRALLEQVKRTCLGAYAHAELPFEQLVRELKPQRDPSRTPLVQAQLAFQEMPGEPPAFGERGVETYGFGLGYELLDLTLALWPVGEGMQGVLSFATDLFERDTMARMAAQLVRLLEEAVRHPERPVGDLEILDGSERRRLLEQWGVAPALTPSARRLEELFEAQVQRTPAAPALITADGSLSYRELDERANRLAHVLGARQLQGELVGVFLPRREELVVTLLAVLKAGAGYVPLDPSYPSERMAYMLGHAQAPLVVASAALAERLAGAATEVLLLDREAERIAAAPSTRPPRNGSAEQLAYVLYTSGSTGVPKGVAVEHPSAAALVRWAQGVFSPAELAGVLASTSICFDLSVFELFVTLSTGGAVVLARDALELATHPAREQVTLINTVPSAMAELLGLGAVPASARCINLAGEPLPAELAARIFAETRAQRVLNLYGPSEDTTYSTWSQVERGAERVCIGRPVSGTRCYVLDERLGLAPVGVAGELYLGGAGLARGYHRAPERTAERFVPDPFGSGSRLYRTGDRVRWNAGGQLEFLGRIDHQVKLRGYRIELGELESALRAEASVGDAVARVWGAGSEARLVAYVVAHEPIDREALMASLGRRLPGYMLPSHLVVLEALPRTPNGKVDRKALPEPQRASQRAYVAPRTPEEQALCTILAEVLRVERVGIEDDFFALGGHSLLATQVVARVRQVLEVELPLRALFEAPQVAALAARVAQSQDRGAGASLEVVPRSEPLPASFAQQRMWFLHELQPESVAYHVPLVLRLAGPLDTGALTQALAELVERHESLRTTFAVEDGRPWQRLAPPGEVVLERADVSGEPDPEAAARARVFASVRQPFDLARGPLHRCLLVRLRERDHVLAWTLHHIVTDGWSNAILLRELGELYRQRVGGGDAGLAPLPYQYADYAAWQRAYLEAGALSEQLAYWKQQLAGAPPALELPADRPRPAQQSYRGAHVELSLSAELTGALRSLCSARGVTPFMALLAGFSVLLARYAGQQEVVVGSPIAGRTRAETESIVGLFVNTLALRVRLEPGQSFEALLAAVKQTCLDAYAHQDLPFERLVEELAPERDLSRTPLFQVMFALQEVVGDTGADFGAVRAEDFGLGLEESKFDLSLALWPEGEGFRGVLAYAAELFDGPTIQRMIASFVTLLGAAVREPQRSVGELPLLDEGERARTLVRCRGPVRALVAGESLLGMFEAQRRARGEATAVRFADQELSYAELGARAHQLAHLLGERGVRAEAPVAVHLGRSLELPLALWGVLASGGVYLPLDPELPDARLHEMIRDAGAELIVTRAADAPRFAGLNVDALCLDAEAEALRRASEAPAADMDERAGAYIIYTSGSTGRPKGVLNTRRGAHNLVRASQAIAAIEPGDGVLVKSAVGFDASWWELVWGLAAGATLHIAPPGAQRDAAELVRLLQSGVTVSFFVPSLLAALLDAGADDALRGLRLVTTGGEAVPARLAADWQARTGVPLLSFYGPTEASVAVSHQRCAEPGPGAVVALGRPLHNASLYVLDPRLELCPVGVFGQIFIAGEPLARGYVGQPALTAERFVPDPFATGQRMYASGDVGRYNDAGQLEFLGRSDHQVKLRGFRIELGEIEAVLEAQAGVARSVVALREVAGERALVAYVVPRRTVASAELWSALAARLPPYMLPSALVILDALPLTTSGKIDRRRLPDPAASDFGRPDYAPPRTPLEETLCSIFAEVLHVERVGIEDDFFALGGHSLLATQAVARIRKVLEVELPLRTLFEAPRVGALAARLGPAGGAASIEPVPRGGLLRVSPAQARMWILHQLDPDSSAYNLSAQVRLLGPLDLDAWNKSIAALLERHESLRARFVTVDGEPRMRVSDPEPMRLVPRACDEETALGEVEELAARPFRLDGEPLVRAGLWRLGPEHHVFALSMHHIVTDGWSMAIALRELGELYAAYARGAEPALEPLPIQYADYAAWQHRMLTGPVLEKLLGYWVEQLGGAPPVVELPTDRVRPARQSTAGALVERVLPASLGARIAELRHQQGVTTFMILLAALQVVLSRWSGQDEVVIGAPIAGRSMPGTDRLVGFFMNMLALRGRLHPEQRFVELLRATKERCLGAYAHQDLPFERLVEELAPERDLSRTPVFQVMLNMQNQPSAAWELAGLVAEPFETRQVGSKLDLTLHAIERGDGAIRLLLVYATALFDAERMDELLVQLECLLEQVTAAPHARIDGISLATPRAAKVLPDPRAPLDASFAGAAHAIIAEQARRNPEAVAVEHQGRRLGYGELEAASDDLAAELLARGLGPGQVIAIEAERRPELVVAWLGVLKSGAAFLMLDPAHPAVRRREQLELAGARLVIELSATGELTGFCPRLRLERGVPSAPRRPRPVELGPDSLAYLAFTSGSTGVPKGVRGRHGSLTHFVPWEKARYGVGATDRYSVLSGLAHDPLHRDVLTPLQLGATVCMPPADVLDDPARVSAWFAEARITVANLTPAMIQLLTEAAHDRAPALRYAFVVGDMLTRDHVRRLRAFAPNATIVNHYGATETQRAVAYHVVDDGWDKSGRAVVPLGRGIQDVQLLVLDAQGRRAGLCEVGELALRSPHIALGYHGDEELTRRRFEAHPDSGDVIYRTGDIGRYGLDGAVEPLGRRDRQVKIRGYRVEPAEVESALVAHPDVDEAVVVPHGDGDERVLVAYAAGPAGPSSEALRCWLLERLPQQMVPAVVMRLERLPRTPNKKIDRAALPPPELPRRDAGAPLVTPTEQALGELWQELLGAGALGADADFFALGGHSLLATRLVARVRRVFGVALPLRTVFEAPRLGALARAIEKLRGAGSSPLPPLERRAPGEPVPASLMQQRLWLLHEIDPDSPAYHVSRLVRLEGRLEAAALGQAFEQLGRRHEALRTRLSFDGQRLWQHIDEQVAFRLEVREAGSEEQARREAEAHRTAAFDLGRGPLVRAKLWRLADDHHLLSVVMHHIVTDGWSMAIALAELGELYRAARAAAEPALPPLAVGYGDFACWQRRYLEGERLEAQLAFWKQHLAGAPSEIDLPVDRPRPARPQHRGAWISRELDASAALLELSRRHGATLFMSLLAAYALLLSRLAGQREVVVGVPVAGRSLPHTDTMVGFFMNTLALRVDCRPRQSFSELLEAVKRSCLAAFDHQDLPFERLVEELAPARDLRRSPVFQVMLNMLNQPRASWQLEGLAAEPEMGSGLSTRYDLELFAREQQGRIAVTLVYDAELFEPERAEAMLEQLEQLISAAAGDPELPVARLPLLDPAARASLLVEANATAQPVPSTTVVEQVLEQARRHPSAPAVEVGGAWLSYAELTGRAAALSARLVELGVGRGDRVGVLLERDEWLVPALLGIMQAGAAYVPLDPSYPRQRLEGMLQDSGARVLVSAAPLVAAVRFEGARVEVEQLAHPASAPPCPLGPDDLAYVIYTSGSTGRPKGVAVRHGSVLGFFASMRREPGMTPADLLVAVTTASFDISVLELLLPLVTGARVRLASREDAQDPARLAALLEGASVMQATPSTWQMLVEAGWAGGELTALCGGEALSGALAASLRGRVSRLYNLYGPTETTIWSTLSPVDDPARIAIGRPIANTTVLVLDPQLEPVPAGVWGELYIGGAGVARGYLGRPDLTAERFVPDALGSGGRLYRTGDRVRWRFDGALEYAGRLDFQVKLRGHRIELGEIEAVLEEHPSVERAVAVVRADRLVAYVTGGDAGSDALREHLRDRLPAYMVPAVVVSLKGWPLTPNGKIDRKALPEPERVVGEEASYVAPRSPLEEVLAGIFAEVLGLERVGIEDDFWALGGHSLLATQLVARIRRVLEVELALRAVFEHPTVASLAERVGGARGAEVPRLVAVGRDGPLPASFAQQRLWFLYELEPDSSAYHMRLSLRLTGRLDVAALAESLAALVERHEILRTSFALRDGSLVQRIAPEAELVLEQVDVSAEAEPEQAARERAAAHVARPFDLERGPLSRCLLVRLGDAEHVLVWSMHHMVSDGWSSSVLLRELGELYTSRVAGRRSRLAPLALQYADYAAWQRSWLQGEALEAQLGYWKQQLSGAPPALELPTDRPRPSVQSFRGGRVALELSAELTASLKALSQEEGATLFMTLLAGFAALLSRYSEQRDIVVGSPIAGRTQAETEPMVGLFVNTLALRVRLDPRQGFRELLRGAKRACLGAYAHQDLPFERLVQELSPERDLSRTPIFQVMLALQDMPGEEADFGELKAAGFGLGAGEEKLDLTLTLWSWEGGLRGTLSYAADLFEEATVEGMGRHLVNLLGAASAAPERPLERLELLDAAERETVLVVPNRTEADYPREQSLPELFRAQARRTPELPAASMGPATLSYAELDARSDRLAGRLAEHGAAAGGLVGILLERSLDMLVSVLAVLKTGAAYVPLDPDYPGERLRFMVQDSGLGVVLAPRELFAERLGDVAVVRIDPSEGAMEGAPLGPRVIDPAERAYVIYTSGSTGRPKGVEVPHGSVVNLLTSMRAEPGMSRSDVLVSVTSLSFDISVLELLLPLLVGARVEIASRQAASDGEHLKALLERTAATKLQATPSTWRLLMAAGWQGGSLGALCGGEALPPALAGQLAERTRSLHNLYGPTETTIWSTLERIEPHAAVLIGRPIANTRAYVLDGALNPTPQGVAGELYLGGAGLARGYLKRPALTAERFVPDPFGDGGARLYRTGDRVRWRREGKLEYLGRLDHQVKLRGHRIELGEIEAALGEHPAVREAVAAVRAGSGEPRLVAYVVAKDGHLDGTELRASLRGRLPDFMVPSAVMIMAALPLTPNGKIDRKALPEPERVVGEEASYVAPRSPLEEVLAGIFAEVLGLERVGIEEDFWALGGHSLLAVRLVTRLREELAITLPLQVIFFAPTVAEMAELLQKEGVQLGV